MKASISELFVSYRYGGDIYNVYTTLKEARTETDKNNHTNSLNSGEKVYKTMTLDKALIQMKKYMTEITNEEHWEREAGPDL